MPENENKKTKPKVTRRERILLFLLVFFLIGLAVASFYSTYFLNQYTNMLQENIESRMAYVARHASETVDAADIAGYAAKVDAARAAARASGTLDEDAFNADMVRLMEEQDFKAVISALRQFAQENDAIYVYVIREIKDGTADNGLQNVLFDSDPNQDYTCDPEKNLSLWYYERPDELTLAALHGETRTTKFGEYTAGYEGIMATYSPIYDENNEVIAIIGVDISDAEIVSLRLRSGVLTYVLLFGVLAIIVIGLVGVMLYRRKAAEQAQANLAKSQFLSRMSHEIRTPMNAIIGFCRMAGNSDDISQIKDYVVNINDSSQFLLQLINSILDISKIEAGKMTLRPVSTSMSALAHNVHSMLHTQAAAKQQNFSLNYDEAIPPYLMCDNTYLTQVIVNLSSNAIKFTPESGEITLDVKLADIRDGRAELSFAVTDNGIGIAPENIEKLFAPFEQGDGSITRKYGGTGLGLAISKLLVEMMGGKIAVDSKPGQGSRFSFNLSFEISSTGPAAEGNGIKRTEAAKAAAPAVPKAAEAAEESLDGVPAGHDGSSDGSLADCGGRCFLVAEDNEINQLIAGSALKEFGAEVEFADNGQIALDMYVQTPNKYDIIFMDIHMPVMDGYESARRIRLSPTARAKSIPIIAMTANVFREDVDAAMKAGMNGHIGKPFDMEQLASAINAVLK